VRGASRWRDLGDSQYDLSDVLSVLDAGEVDSHLIRALFWPGSRIQQG
jgi:hypothetical protein